MRRPLYATAFALIVVSAMALVNVPAASATQPVVISFHAALSDVNLVTLSWATTGGDTFGSQYITDLTDEGNLIGFVAQSGTFSYRVTSIGVHRYSLSVTNSAGQSAASTTSYDVAAPLPPPTVTSADPLRIDNLASPEQTPLFTWTKQSASTSRVTFATLTQPDWKMDSGSTTSSYTPPTAAYKPALGAGSKTGSGTVAQCTHGSDTASLLCSQPVALTVVDGPARIISPGARVYVAPGQNTTFTWNPGPTGATYNLVSTAIGYNQWTASTSRTVTIPSTASGLIDFTLTECVSGICYNRFDPVSPVAGTITSITPLNTVVGPPNANLHISDVVATVQASDGTVSNVTTEPLMGTTAGTMGFPDTNPATQQPFKVGDTISAGAKIAFVIVDNQAHSDHVQIYASTQTWTTTPYTSDYVVDPTMDRWATWKDPNLGAPDSTQVTANGDIFTVGEFSRSLSQMSAGGAVSAHDVPLLTKFVTGTSSFQRVKPFIGRDHVMPVTYSEFTEQDTVDPSGKIWFPQGGYGFFTPQDRNHSRIVSFNPAGTDDPNTVDDERICAYNVPATSVDAAHHNYFDTTAFGISAVGNRIYFVEARPGQASALTWFVPSEFPSCSANKGANNNYYDFEADQTAPAGPSPGYCAQPSDTGCFHTKELKLAGANPDLHATIAAYPVYDSAANAIWIGEFFGQRLYKYDIATDSVTSYPVDPPRRPANTPALGNIMTSLAVDANYVYYLGASDGSVNRFNKAQATGGGCDALDTGGNNACVQQIFLPLASNVDNGDQLSLANGKLWFTIDGTAHDWIDPDSGVVGFVSTTTWSPGTIYTALETAGDPVLYRTNTSIFGINAVASGAVLVTDYGRGQVLRLWPKNQPR